MIHHLAESTSEQAGEVAKSHGEPKFTVIL
jgi:hypothetical protein